MFDYIYKAITVCFLGFFPFFELIVAIPAGISLRLDPVSTVVFCVAGNFLPVFVIEYGYSRLIRYKRIRRWLERRVSDRLVYNVNRYGTWYVLLFTPWLGIWAVALTARILKMNPKTLAWSSFSSLVMYSVALVVLIQAGIDFFSR